mgnify:CR=1 FL=1
MDNQNKNQNNKNNRQGLSFILIVTLVTTLLVMALYQFQGAGSDQEISYNEFLKMVDDGDVEKVVIQSNQIVITAKPEDGERVGREYYTGLVQDDTLSERLYDAGVDYEQEIPYDFGNCDPASCNLPANRTFGRNDRLDDQADEQGRRHDGNRQEQCQDVCGKADRRDVPGCGRTG